jgi:hypothetical protein
MQNLSRKGGEKVKRFLWLFVFVAAALVLVPSAEAQSQKCEAAAASFLAADAQDLQLLIPGLTPAPQEKGPVCPFCNLTSYSSCESLDGNSCGVEGSSRRCYVEPACYCEWGVCRCQSGTWNCFW